MSNWNQLGIDAGGQFALYQLRELHDATCNLKHNLYYPTPLDEYVNNTTNIQTGGLGPLDYTPWDDSYAYNDNTLANGDDESVITAGIFTGVGSISEIGDDSNNPFNPDASGADFNSGGNTMNFFPGNVTEGFATAAWRDVTRSYWQSYSYNKRNVFFIDSARCYNLTIGGNNYNNSRPTGLDEGTIPTNISGCLLYTSPSPRDS